MNLHFIQDFYQNFDISEGVQVILSIGLILLVAFALTRLTKLFKLPNVTAYILSGVLIGPFVLNLIPESMIAHMDFITDIALGFIAFGVGKYFDLRVIKKNGLGVIFITCLESFLAAGVVSLTMILVFKLPIPFSLLLGAIGAATSPASTIMTIRQYRCHGNFVDNVLEVVALDDATSLLAFSVCSAVAVAMMGGSAAGNFDFFKSIVLPLLLNIAAIGLGFLFGFLLVKVITPRRTADNRLILVTALVLLLVAVCGLANIIDPNISVSPLLACMVMGSVYVNLTKDKILFHQLNDFSAPICLLFFVKSGLAFDVDALATAGLIGIVYFLVRIAGKYAGASLGAFITKAKPEVKKYLGMALIPQAGVSIGLATLGARILQPEYGNMLSTIIISSGILYELIGPAMARLALSLSGSMPDKKGAAQQLPVIKAEAAPPTLTASLKEKSRIFRRRQRQPLVFVYESEVQQDEKRRNEEAISKLEALQEEVKEYNRLLKLEQKESGGLEPLDLVSSTGIGPFKHRRFADRKDRDK